VECPDDVAAADWVDLGAMEKPAAHDACARRRGHRVQNFAGGASSCKSTRMSISRACDSRTHSYVRFSLATGLHVISAHERRHLWQAWRVRQPAERALASE